VFLSRTTLVLIFLSLALNEASNATWMLDGPWFVVSVLSYALALTWLIAAVWVGLRGAK
jgi:hypothetical protein